MAGSNVIAYRTPSYTLYTGVHLLQHSSSHALRTHTLQPTHSIPLTLAHTYLILQKIMCWQFFASLKLTTEQHNHQGLRSHCTSNYLFHNFFCHLHGHPHFTENGLKCYPLICIFLPFFSKAHLKFCIIWLSNLNEVSRDARHCDHLPCERRRSRHPPKFHSF